jgi:hypothetical protein
MTERDQKLVALVMLIAAGVVLLGIVIGFLWTLFN